MIDNKLLKDFYDKLKIESNFKKVLNKDIINILINYLTNYDIKKIEYPLIIENPLELVLNYYKEMYPNYYQLLINGIKSNRITFLDKDKSFVDTNDYCNIKLNHNDSDIFMIVHELAHYIDRNSNPKLIPNEYNILSEVIPFYMEKQLEIYLGCDYQDLIDIRKNNRLYFEKRFLKIIEIEMFYEESYLNGTLVLTDKDNKNIKKIMNLGLNNIINYLLRYPLANVLSDYLINNPQIEINNNISDALLKLNLFELLYKSKNFNYLKTQ